jgi:hypothetical protein
MVDAFWKQVLAAWDFPSIARQASSSPPYVYMSSSVKNYEHKWRCHSVQKPVQIKYAELSADGLRELANAELKINENLRQQNRGEQIYLLAVTRTDKT